MILIGIGSNLAFPPAATPLATVSAALAALPAHGVRIIFRSGWYESEPVPPSDQPWYVNGVASVVTELTPAALLEALLALEGEFGRERVAPNAARTLDLDLLDYDFRLCNSATLTLPHPRLHQRRFVLVPLCEIASEWRHPRLERTAAELLARLPQGQSIRRFAD